jgi:hypothetical protein
VLAPNNKQHMLSPAKVRIIYVTYVILWLKLMSNVFILIYSGGGGATFMKHFNEGHKL